MSTSDRMSIVAVLAACLCAVSALSRAQAGTPPVFIIETIDGPLPPAPLAKLGGDWSIQLGGETPRTVAGAEWIELRQPGKRLPPFPTSPCALLTSGDRVLLEPNAPFRLDEERISLRLANGADVSLPLAYLSYLSLRAPKYVDNPELFLARVDKAKRPQDVIYLADGDVIAGALAFPAHGPLYKMKLGERIVEVPLTQVAVFAVNTELRARPKPKKTFAHVVTTSGARLQFSTLRLAEGSQTAPTLWGKTLFGPTLAMPLEEVAVLTLRQGAAEYLSDLTPKSYQFTPFLGITWPLVRDAAVSGRQLALGHDFYDKGLGSHAQSQVSYALDGKYRRFDALVGLAAGRLKTTQVQLRVAVDGNLTSFTKTLTPQDSPVPVKIDVRAARELTLVVDFGAFGDIEASVNWADARLIRDAK